MHRTCSAILVGGLALLGGCASKREAARVKPSPDEMPQLAELRVKTQQASVYAEGQRGAPRLALVPDFKEPELTAEERAALGQRELVYRPLLYPDAVRSPNRPVGNMYAEVETFAWGRGGAAAYRDFATYVAGVTTDWESMEVGYTLPVAPAGTIYLFESPAGAYYFLEAGPAVGIEPASEISTHEPWVPD